MPTLDNLARWIHLYPIPIIRRFISNVILQVEGVQGIMAAYRHALHTVSLHGPTLFGQVINQAAEIAAQSLSTNSTNYFILLIITVNMYQTIIYILSQNLKLYLIIRMEFLLISKRLKTHSLGPLIYLSRF